MTLRIPLSTTLPGPRPGVVYVATEKGLELKRVKSRARAPRTGRRAA